MSAELPSDRLLIGLGMLLHDVEHVAPQGKVERRPVGTSEPGRAAGRELVGV